MKPQDPKRDYAKNNELSGIIGRSPFEGGRPYGKKEEFMVLQDGHFIEYRGPLSPSSSSEPDIANQTQSETSEILELKDGIEE